MKEDKVIEATASYDQNGNPMRIFDDACGDGVDAHAEEPSVGLCNLFRRRIGQDRYRHWNAVATERRLLVYRLRRETGIIIQGPLPFQDAKPATNGFSQTSSRQDEPNNQVLSRHDGHEGFISFRPWWRLASGFGTMHERCR